MLVPRVTIVPTEDVDKATLDAIAEVSQQANGALRVKMHDKHAALVSLGKHLGLFTDSVQIKAVYGIRDKPMTAEEWEEAIREAGVMFARAKPAGVAASSGATAGADAVSSTLASENTRRALIVCDFKEMGRLPMASASARFRTIQMCPKDLVREWRHSRPQGR